MADPRFYTNRGPLKLAELCACTGTPLPDQALAAIVTDVATLESAGGQHLVFCAGKAAGKQLAHSLAGAALVESDRQIEAHEGIVVLRTPAPADAFATAARLFYPDHGLARWDQDVPVSRAAKIDEGVHIAPGAVIGAGAEIGKGTRIGANVAIGPGVCIGRDCEIGGNTTITHSLLGDEVMVLSGAQIGGPGFGFSSGARGHTKIPQLGRVILQDRVEVGACTTIDRGALADTVIGEGTKIDNLVQIGHNCRIGRHCVIVGQVGISGSSELGDFVVLGGQVGLADHVKIGDGARLAARSGVAPGELPGGQDYGGAPPLPIREWRRQMAAIARLTKPRKLKADG
ncbi:MAG TPA: UDP-3-O-(3-hydroxymyristoyl)glucosamine N-acyltransferase [Rhizomicrobium sp.]